MNFGELWSVQEKQILAGNYGKISKQELMALLPNRTWRTIMERARKLGANGSCNTGQNRYRVDGDTAILYLDRRNGEQMECLISRMDLESVLSVGKWRADYKPKSQSYYARCNVVADGKKTYVYLHRILADCPDDMQVDHIDFNTLNNQRDNLRVVSKSGNMQNRPGAQQNNQVGHRNIYWHKTLKLWVIKVRCAGREITKYSKELERAKQIAEDLRKTYLPYSTR